MSRTKIKKQKIFNYYSNNLKWISERTNIKSKKKFDKGIFCPICLNIFEESHLEKNLDNYLTLEHNPPESLGGKANILTCKNCNNISGHKLDNALLKYLLEENFKNHKPNSSHWTKLGNHNGDKVAANIKWDKDGKLIINVNSKHSNPKDLNNIIESEEKGIFTSKEDPLSFYTSKWNFNFPAPNTSDMRIASIALLKIGYLLAFEKFGHIFLFNKNLEIIRKQILNPEEKIITDPFWINYNLPEMYMGVSLIEKPKELKSFVSTFKLSTPSGILQISIVFPKYGDTDNFIYQNIKKELCTDEKGDKEIRITTLEPYIDLRDENKVLYPFKLPVDKEASL